MTPLTYKRAAVNVQILYLRMASVKNCLDFQIPLRHKEKCTHLLKTWRGFHVRYFYKYERWHGI